MTYVISDLHGSPLEKFKKLLENANFSDGEVEMRLWALQYALQVKVISPQSLVDDIKCDIIKTDKKYKGE